MNTLPPSPLNGNPLLIDASGIYKITCTGNKKIYIGSSSDMRKRQYHHLYDLRNNKHDNTSMQRSFNRHGEQSFIFEIVEMVLTPFLLEREQYWLDKIKPFAPKGFNMALVAGAPRRGRKASPETIEKQRQGNLGKKRSPEECERIRQRFIGNTTWRGREHTPETREKMRQARMGNTYNRGRKHTPEARANMKGHPGNTYGLGKKRPIEAIEATRQANLGRKMSPEAIEKSRQANLGRKQSPEEIEKRRQSNLGKKRTPEQIENIRQGRLAKKKERDELS